MARAQSAGVILYRRRGGRVEVLLVHPGGPFWARRDEGAWSVPKGGFTLDEGAEAAARREFQEETGIALTMPLVPLPAVAQSRGKTVHPFTAERDLDPADIQSNTFVLEWPPKSGRMQAFPEVDRAAWFSLEEARGKIVAGQRPILDELAKRLTSD